MQWNVKQILENGRNKGMKLWISVMQNIFDMKSSHLDMNIWWKLHLVKSKVSMSRTISKFVWRVVVSVTRNLQGLAVKSTALSLLSQLLEYASQFYCSYWWLVTATNEAFQRTDGWIYRYYDSHSSRFLSHQVQRPSKVRSCLSSGNIPAIHLISFMRNSHLSHIGIRTKQNTVFFV